MSRIRVQVMGGTREGSGEAAGDHLTAIRSLPEFEVCEADHVAHERRGDVGLVVFAAEGGVPHATIETALKAGQSVLSNWPIGSCAMEAADLAATARGAGARTFVALTGRYVPAVRQAHDLVRRGFVGHVLAASLVAATPPTAAWALPHVLDTLTHVLGDVDRVAASMAWPRAREPVDANKRMATLARASHIAFSGQFTNGAVLSVLYRGGIAHRGQFRWTIHGTDGDLELVARDGDIRSAAVALTGGCGADVAMTPLDLPPSLLRSGGGWGESDPVANLRRLYLAVAGDLRRGTVSVAGFDDAVALHRRLAAVEASAESGVSQFAPRRGEQAPANS